MFIMSYYMGDFYQGDPGFFSALGGILRRVGPAVAGLMPGGGAVTALAKIGTTALARRGVTRAAAGALARRAGAAVVAHPVISAAAGAGVIGAAATIRARAPSTRMASAMQRAYGPAGGGRRHRRMNPYNPKALRRAVRRAHAFARMARHVLRFVSPKAPKGRAIFRVHRKRKV